MSQFNPIQINAPDAKIVPSTVQYDIIESPRLDMGQTVNPGGAEAFFYEQMTSALQNGGAFVSQVAKYQAKKYNQKVQRFSDTVKGIISGNLSTNLTNETLRSMIIAAQEKHGITNHSVSSVLSGYESDNEMFMSRAKTIRDAWAAPKETQPWEDAPEETPEAVTADTMGVTGPTEEGTIPYIDPEEEEDEEWEAPHGN